MVHFEHPRPGFRPVLDKLGPQLQASSLQLVLVVEVAELLGRDDGLLLSLVHRPNLVERHLRLLV